MGVCEECKGTGRVTLFTTSRPCKTCTREEGRRASERSGQPDNWEAFNRVYQRSLQHCRDVTAKKIWMTPLVPDSKKQEPVTFHRYKECPLFPLRMMDFYNGLIEDEQWWKDFHLAYKKAGRV